MIIVVDNFPYIVLRIQKVKHEIGLMFDLLTFYEIINPYGKQKVYYTSINYEQDVKISETNFYSLENIMESINNSYDRDEWSFNPIENIL